jgi:8-oxo-dGTP diphosphatase
VIHPELTSEVLVKKMSDQLTHIVCVTRFEFSKPAVSLSWEHEGYEWLTLEQLRNKDLPTIPDDYYITILEHIAQNDLT